ncbi:MAG: AzlD domain-containing protein [Clostridia bacterium]|nr:AzlD domain-containing protein [Clostridia bacterium]
MNNSEFFLYLLIMSGSTYLIRAVPFALMRKKIKNPFINSFLHYIPYTVLAAMTFPSALYATGGNVPAAAVGLLAAVLVSLKTKNLTVVAITGCVAVFLADLIFSVLAA